MSLQILAAFVLNFNLKTYSISRDIMKKITYVNLAVDFNHVNGSRLKCSFQLSSQLIFPHNFPRIRFYNIDLGDTTQLI